MIMIATTITAMRVIPERKGLLGGVVGGGLDSLLTRTTPVIEEWIVQ